MGALSGCGSLINDMPEQNRCSAVACAVSRAIGVRTFRMPAAPEPVL